MSPHTTTTTITAYSISAITNIDTVCISVSDQQRDWLTDSSAQCCVLLLSSVFVSVAETEASWKWNQGAVVVMANGCATVTLSVGSETHAVWMCEAATVAAFATNDLLLKEEEDRKTLCLLSRLPCPPTHTHKHARTHGELVFWGGVSGSPPWCQMSTLLLWWKVSASIVLLPTSTFFKSSRNELERMLKIYSIWKH